MSDLTRVRVGMVGADIIHALEYASIINTQAASGPALPMLKPLQSHMEERLASVRTHPPLEPEHVTTADEIRSDPLFQGVCVTAWWAPDRTAARLMAERAGVAHVCGSLDELVREVDAVMVCSRNGADHFAFALPALSAGKPTYIDKPFAEDAGLAQTMVATARRTGALLFTSSPWKWAPIVQQTKARLDELGELRTLLVSGPGEGGDFFYVSHSVETALHLLGGGAETVTCLRDEKHHAITFRYGDGRFVVVNAMREIAWLRHFVIYGENGYLEAEITNSQRDEGKVRMVVEFVHAMHSGVEPTPAELGVESVAIMVGARRSADAGGVPVALREVMG